MFAQRARTPVLSSRSRAGPAGPSPRTGLADGFGPEVALPRSLADSPQQTWVPGSPLPRWGQPMRFGGTGRRRPGVDDRCPTGEPTVTLDGAPTQVERPQCG